mmetsp:Transcript_13397/g.38062  ORF Transcript_13397/g.38062 Transcript_13397/m.38062 type:complete len:159 (+) Transcript_13397:108-584(+)
MEEGGRVPQKGFLELLSEGGVQWLCHSLTGERRALDGEGWGVAYDEGGWAYLFRGCCVQWADDILSKDVFCEGATIKITEGGGFKVVGSDEFRIEHRYLPVPHANTMVLKIFNVLDFAFGVQVWWQPTNLQQGFADASNHRLSSRSYSEHMTMLASPC